MKKLLISVLVTFTLMNAQFLGLRIGDSMTEVQNKLSVNGWLTRNAETGQHYFGWFTVGHISGRLFCLFDEKHTLLQAQFLSNDFSDRDALILIRDMLREYHLTDKNVGITPLAEEIDRAYLAVQDIRTLSFPRELDFFDDYRRFTLSLEDYPEQLILIHTGHFRSKSAFRIILKPIAKTG